jgi:hypothetical protein
MNRLHLGVPRRPPRRYTLTKNDWKYFVVGCRAITEMTRVRTPYSTLFDVSVTDLSSHECFFFLSWRALLAMVEREVNAFIVVATLKGIDWSVYCMR